jgi:hypothetical protein
MADHTSAATEAGGDGPPPEPTFSELLEALCAAEFALQRAADYIQHREGVSSEFRAVIRRALAVKREGAGGDG